MQPPRNIKETQGLTRRITALNRFVSRSTDKCLPFFKVLKKAFKWTNECQQAFEELKEYLATPPLLSPFKPGEELYLYHFTNDRQFSALTRREWSTAARLLHQLGPQRSRRTIPSHGKASVHSCNRSKEASTILPSPHNSITHQSFTAEGNEQTRYCQTTHTMVDRTQRIRY